MALNNSYPNSPVKLYIGDGAEDGGSTAETFTFVPTTRLDETENPNRETWYSTSDVVSNVPYQNGLVTAVALAIDCEATWEQDGLTPVGLKAGLAIIWACYMTIGSSRRKHCLRVFPDGTMRLGWFDVMNIKPLQGDSSNVGKLTWQLVSAGADAVYEGAAPA